MLLKKSRLFSIVVCMFTVLSVLSLMIPKNLSAEENGKTLTLVCVSDETILTGMEWRLHKVGERVNNSRNFVQTGDFSGIQINMRRLTPETVQQAAQTFQAYAMASGIEPLQIGITNEYGEVQFTGLESGLYMISGKTLKTDSHYYQPTTALVEIKEEDSDLKYNAYPKFEYQVMNAQPKAHVVYKEWLLDEAHLDLRPDHVTVDIYKDEEYYDTITLSEENKWRYRWVDSTGLSSWLVMEKEVPEHYEVNIEYNENYRIQNSYTEETYFTTTASGSQTATTTTTASTSISVGQINTGVSTSTTASYQNIEFSKTRTTTASTTSPYQNTEFSRTRTTTTTGITGASTDTHTTTNTANVESGAMTRTNNTSATQANASATTAGTSTNNTGSTSGTTTRSAGGGNGSGNGGGGNSVGKINNSSNKSNGSTKLPQTGQLWWPVVPLSMGGILFVSAGLVIRARKKSDD